MENEVVVLFDEYGTPTFGERRDTDYFVGVAASYENNSETDLFEKCNLQFGLSNKKPLKNTDIKPSRVGKIANLIAEIPVEVYVVSLDIGNSDLKRVVELYEEYGNELRRIHRGLRERPIAQILHSQILSHTTFLAVTKYIESTQRSTSFSVYIDNWSFPVSDESLALKVGRESMEQRVNEINAIFFPDVQIKLNNYFLLKDDSKRKRFIDVITSAVSRGFQSSGDPRYVADVLDIILNNDQTAISEIDITTTTIETLTKIMDDTARWK